MARYDFDFEEVWLGGRNPMADSGTNRTGRGAAEEARTRLRRDKSCY